MTKPIVWTERHEIEAMRTVFRLAGEAMADGIRAESRARNLCTASLATEREFVVALTRGGLDAARIARELRRVDGLATGRLVRETETVLRAVARDNGTVSHEWPHGVPGVSEAVSAWFDGRRSLYRLVRVRRTTIRKAR